MAWYGWLLILAAIAGFAYLKVKIGGAWMRKQKAKKEQRDKAMEDED